MMNAMGRHPENRTALQRQSGAPGEEVLDPLRSRVSAMRQQPVIAHADPEAARDPPQKCGDKKCFPGEEKERRRSAYMKQEHGRRCAPIETVFVGLSFPQAGVFHSLEFSPHWLR